MCFELLERDLSILMNRVTNFNKSLNVTSDLFLHLSHVSVLLVKFLLHYNWLLLFFRHLYSLFCNLYRFSLLLFCWSLLLLLSFCLLDFFAYDLFLS
jgi:hypothetical protein